MEAEEEFAKFNRGHFHSHHHQGHHHHIRRWRWFFICIYICCAFFALCSSSSSGCPSRIYRRNSFSWSRRVWHVWILWISASHPFTFAQTKDATLIYLLGPFLCCCSSLHASCLVLSCPSPWIIIINRSSR